MYSLSNSPFHDLNDSEFNDYLTSNNVFVTGDGFIANFANLYLPPIVRTLLVALIQMSFYREV